MHDFIVLTRTVYKNEEVLLFKERKKSVEKTGQRRLIMMTGHFPFTLKHSFDLVFSLLQAGVLYLDFLKSIFLKEIYFYVFIKLFNLCECCVNGFVWVVPVLVRGRQLKQNIKRGRKNCKNSRKTVSACICSLLCWSLLAGNTTR